MDSIHVILCGKDAFRIESALQGTLEMRHVAWRQQYRVSCTNALSVDEVDHRLLLVCHVIVLCKGCRCPESSAAYNGRPVIALDDATEACVAAISGMDFFYGSTTLEGLREQIVTVGLTPLQVIYDTLLQCLTPMGEAAMHRAFWLLDKRTSDGVLDMAELLAWCRLIKGSGFTEAQLTPFLQEHGLSERSSLTEEAFIKVHLTWLSQGKTEDAWATLNVMGTHPTGLPFSWYDLNSMRIDRDVNTYLSPHAIPFFTSVYKRLRLLQDGGDLWRLTPGCPWEGVHGFLTADIPLDKFIEYWKYMALERRDLVIQYARYWGYKGEASFLFVRRNTHACRGREEVLPNMVQVLVVGAARCGKKSLLFSLTAGDGEHFSVHTDCELYVRTTTFYAAKGLSSQKDEPQSIAYTTVSSEKAELILTNENLNKTFDVVLLCYDSSDTGPSGKVLMDLYERTMRSNASARMPFVVVATKTDLDPCIGPATERLEWFCRSRQLLWPAVATSATRHHDNDTAALHEYMYAVAVDPDMAVGPAPLTWVRTLRRATLTAIVAVSAVGLLQTAVTALIRRRRR